MHSSRAIANFIIENTHDNQMLDSLNNIGLKESIRNKNEAELTAWLDSNNFIKHQLIHLKNIHDKGKINSSNGLIEKIIGLINSAHRMQELNTLLAPYDRFVSDMESKVWEKPTPIVDITSYQHARLDSTDPFDLFPAPRLQTLELPLSQLLADPAINLIKPIKKINPQIDFQHLAGNGEGIQPIHIIWVGGNLTDEGRWNNLIHLQELNPKTEIILWVHQLYHSIDIDNPMVKRCQELGVHVIPIDKVFGKHLSNPHQKSGFEQVDFWSIHMDGMLKSMYGWVSDFDRYVILYSFGGIYCDLDSKMLKGVENLQVNSGLYISRAQSGFINDLLAANKYNDRLAQVILDISISANMSLTEAIPYLHDRHSSRGKYKFNYQNMDIIDDEYANSYTLIYTLTILTTGSNMLVKQFNEPGEVHYVPQEHIFPNGYIKRSCDGSWTNSRLILLHFNGDADLAIKVVLTNILNDLKREPRFLYLDRYKLLCEEFNIGDIVFEILLSNPWLEKLSQIEYASIFASCKSFDTFNKLFDKGYFPSLIFNQPNSSDADYYIKRFSKTLNLELLAYLQSHGFADQFNTKKLFTIINHHLRQEFTLQKAFSLHYLIENYLLQQLPDFIDSYMEYLTNVRSNNCWMLLFLILNTDINESNRYGDLYLSYANRRSYSKDELVLVYAMIVKLIINKQLFNNDIYIHIARIVDYNDNFIELANLLLEDIPTFDGVDGRNGMSILYDAIQHHAIPIIIYLLNKNANIHNPSNRYKSAIDYAIYLFNETQNADKKLILGEIVEGLKQYDAVKRTNLLAQNNNQSVSVASRSLQGNENNGVNETDESHRTISHTLTLQISEGNNNVTAGSNVIHNHKANAVHPWFEFKLIDCLDHSYKTQTINNQPISDYQNALAEELRYIGEYDDNLLVVIAENSFNQKALAIRFSSNSNLFQYLNKKFKDNNKFQFKSITDSSFNEAQEYPCIFASIDQIQLLHRAISDYNKFLRNQIIHSIDMQIIKLQEKKFSRLFLDELPVKVKALEYLKKRIINAPFGSSSLKLLQIINDWENTVAFNYNPGHGKSQKQLTNKQMIAVHRNVFFSAKRNNLTDTEELIEHFKHRLKPE